MYKRFWKRFWDCVLSALALILLLPLLLLLTAVGAVAMRGNPFFTQLRPGMIDKRTGKERIFKLVKFRTMSNQKDAQGKLLPDEKRLNGYGRFLRKTSLDELPELLCIFAGTMSFVGPRPQLVRDMVFMDARQRTRHTVLPGLTGLAQVSGRNTITWEEKFEYDLRYIEDGITFAGDCKILFRTVGKVFSAADTVRDGTESDIDFGDWLLLRGSIDAAYYEARQTEAKELQKQYE